jgi:hypothetical protein
VAVVETATGAVAGITYGYLSRLDPVEGYSFMPSDDARVGDSFVDGVLMPASPPSPPPSPPGEGGIE